MINKRYLPRWQLDRAGYACDEAVISFSKRTWQQLWRWSEKVFTRSERGCAVYLPITQALTLALANNMSVRSHEVM